MAFIAQFRGKQRQIVERSLRGEAPEDVAVAVPTTVQYVYNVRRRARALGINFPQTFAPIAQNPVNHAGEANHAPMQNQPAIAMPDARNLNQAETIDDDNADVRARIREQERLAQRRQLLDKEEHLKAIEEENQLRTEIADITRDPSELLRNRLKYLQAMNNIARTPPWSHKLREVTSDWYEWDVRLNYVIQSHYTKMGADGKLASSHSKTPVRDLVNDFIVFAANSEIAVCANVINYRKLFGC